MSREVLREIAKREGPAKHDKLEQAQGVIEAMWFKAEVALENECLHDGELREYAEGELHVQWCDTCGAIRQGDSGAWIKPEWSQ